LYDFGVGIWREGVSKLGLRNIESVSNLGSWVCLDIVDRILIY
jgi:hypothetical protein